MRNSLQSPKLSLVDRTKKQFPLLFSPLLGQVSLHRIIAREGDGLLQKIISAEVPSKAEEESQPPLHELTR